MLLPCTCRALNRVRYSKLENIAAHPRPSLFHNFVFCIQTRTHTAHEDIELVCFQSALDVSFVFDCSASIVNDFVNWKNKNKFVKISHPKSRQREILFFHYQNIKSTLMIDTAKMKFHSAWLRLLLFALLKAFSTFRQQQCLTQAFSQLRIQIVFVSNCVLCKRLADAIRWSGNAIDDLCK